MSRRTGGRLWKLSSSLGSGGAAKPTAASLPTHTANREPVNIQKASFVSPHSRFLPPSDSRCALSPFLFSPVAASPLTVRQQCSCVSKWRPRQSKTRPRAGKRASRRRHEETVRGIFFFFGQLSHIFTSESANQTHLGAGTNTNIPPPCAHAPPANNAPEFLWPSSCSVTGIISCLMDLRTP